MNHMARASVSVNKRPFRLPQSGADPGSTEPAPVFCRYEDMHAERPDTAYLPARWWRHVVARACEEIPGVGIVAYLPGD